MTASQISTIKRCYSVLSRCKVDVIDSGTESKLDRVLGLFDLTLMGVGSTLGLGVYVLAGAVAKDTAGPAVTISFLIAAVASGLAGICYAEFASRVPKAGSAYTYSYVTVGEFCAFIIGWNLILEYAIGTASVAKGLSVNIDSMFDYRMNTTLRKILPLSVSFLSAYPDFLAASLVMLLTILLAWGVKESSMVNNIFSVVNLATVTIVIVFGLFKANPSFWNIPKETLIANNKTDIKIFGDGGFMPFRWSGVIAGAAKCFYGFVGFDVIATTGEETKNPKKIIPLSIVLSLIVIFISYFGVAAVLTMMVPYYDQDSDIPLVVAFQKVNMGYLQYIIQFGAVSALSASLLGAIFPLPRILYAMAEDGLLHSCLARINTKTKTPIVATFISGSLAAVLSAIFNLTQLMNMMSIGTLLAYTVVTVCILLLRYQKSEPETLKQPNTTTCEASIRESATHIRPSTLMHNFKVVFNLIGSKYTSAQSYNVVKIALFLFTSLSSAMNYLNEYGGHLSTYVIPVLIILCIICFIILVRQPQTRKPVMFKVPLVPLLPCISIMMNMYLMVKLDIDTWIRFVIWLFIGFVIYVLYSINHSAQGRRDIVALEVQQRGRCSRNKEEMR